MFKSKEYQAKIKELETQLAQYKYKETTTTIGEEIGFIIKEVEGMTSDTFSKSKIIQNLIMLAGMISTDTLNVADAVWKGKERDE